MEIWHYNSDIHLLLVWHYCRLHYIHILYILYHILKFPLKFEMIIQAAKFVIERKLNIIYKEKTRL